MSAPDPQYELEVQKYTNTLRKFAAIQVILSTRTRSTSG